MNDKRRRYKNKARHTSSKSMTSHIPVENGKGSEKQMKRIKKTKNKWKKKRLLSNNYVRKPSYPLRYNVSLRNSLIVCIMCSDTMRCHFVSSRSQNKRKRTEAVQDICLSVSSLYISTEMRYRICFALILHALAFRMRIKNEKALYTFQDHCRTVCEISPPVYI